MRWKPILFILFSFLVGCSTNNTKEAPPVGEETIEVLAVPDTAIDKALLTYDRKKSVWTYQDKLFSGYAVSKFENDSMMQKFGILNGKKENQSIDWSPNGLVRSISNYHLGKLHGEKKTWSNDSAHVLIAHLNYYLGKVHGEQKKWYPTGEIFKILHIEMGKEEGVQQAFRKNGILFANYEAKAGRIFGLKKAALCFGLEDQKIKNEE